MSLLLSRTNKMTTLSIQIPKNIDQIRNDKLLSIDRSLKHVKSPRDSHVIKSNSSSASIEPRRIKPRRKSPRLQLLKVPTDESLQEPKRDDESPQAWDDESLYDLKRDNESPQARDDTEPYSNSIHSTSTDSRRKSPRFRTINNNSDTQRSSLPINIADAPTTNDGNNNNTTATCCSVIYLK